MKSIFLSLLAPFSVIFIALAMHFGIGAVDNGYYTNQLTQVGIAIVLAVSLNIVNGFSGQFSLGHAGFAAIGGYVAGALLLYGSIRLFGERLPGGVLSFTRPLEYFQGSIFGWGDLYFPAVIICAGLLAAGVGWVVGLPSLRLRGDYFAIVTVGFGEIVRVLLQSSNTQVSIPQIPTVDPTRLATSLGGALGFNYIPKYASLFWVFLSVGVVCVAAYRLKYSRFGRAYLAIREDEIAAAAMGVSTIRCKVQACMIAAFFAGVAGALLASSQGTINAGDLAFIRSLEIVIMVVLGGLGSISGAVIAATVLTVLPEVLQAEVVQRYRLILYALILIVVMILRPRGLFGLREIWDLFPKRITTLGVNVVPPRKEDRN